MPDPAPSQTAQAFAAKTDEAPIPSLDYLLRIGSVPPKEKKEEPQPCSDQALRI